MSESTPPIDLDAARARAEAAKYLSARFRDMHDEPTHGWSALCPCCDGETRVFISRTLAISTCPNGHTAGQIKEQLDRGDDAPSSSRFQLEPASALLAEIIPPTKWLLSPYVPAGSFGELVGPPGKGKTTFMAWVIAQMAAAGHRCVVIEEEGSRRGLQRLLRRALAAVGPEAVSRVYFKHAAHFNLCSEIDVQDLSEELKSLKIDFVLFDSFALVTPGLDEDKSKEMGPVIKNMLRLIHDVGCAAWLNHHSSKSKWGAGEIPKLGDGRGSSALPGALDAELSMRPCESEEGFIEFDLFVTKMREGDDQVRPQHVRIDRNGSAATCQMEDLVLAEKPSGQSSSVDKMTDLLMRDVRVPTSFDTAMAGGAIAKMLKVSRTDCIKAIKVLCDDGLFVANAATAQPFKRYYRCNQK